MGQSRSLHISPVCPDSLGATLFIIDIIRHDCVPGVVFRLLSMLVGPLELLQVWNPLCQLLEVLLSSFDL